MFDPINKILGKKINIDIKSREKEEIIYDLNAKPVYQKFYCPYCKNREKGEVFFATRSINCTKCGESFEWPTR